VGIDSDGKIYAEKIVLGQEEPIDFNLIETTKTDFEAGTLINVWAKRRWITA